MTRAEEIDAAFLAGARAMQERVAEWLDGGKGGDSFDPVIPISKHMNLSVLSREDRARLEGVMDAILASAVKEIRNIDPATIKPPSVGSTSLPSPVLGMRVWAKTRSTVLERADAVESRTWDVDLAWPGMTWDDVTFGAVRTDEIVCITDYRKGDVVLWERE